VTYSVFAQNGFGTGGTTYSVGITWKQTTPQPPTCTLSASNSSPSVGSPITITSSCSNSPLSYTWKAGCTSTTSSCTDTSSTAGAKVYTMAATNAAGNSPDTSITVNWQPLPTAAPVCTVTSSSGATNPYTNTNITLTATCNNSPASYAWTGCTSTGSTCSTTSANVGPVTYGVTATNVIGTSTPATVTVTWDKSTGGANFCGPNTAYIDVPWGAAGPNGGRWLTSTNGGFPQGKVFVFSITVPAGTPHSSSSQKFAMAEYQGPPAPRTLMLSENACDFPPSTTYLDGASGTAPLIDFNVGSGPGAALQPGKTYYFSIRNDNCSQSSCDMSLSIPWHN
jgi:large repetitive protein